MWISPPLFYYLVQSGILDLMHFSIFSKRSSKLLLGEVTAASTSLCLPGESISLFKIKVTNKFPFTKGGRSKFFHFDNVSVLQACLQKMCFSKDIKLSHIGFSPQQSCEMEAKIRKVRDVGFLYKQKVYIRNSIYDSISICIHFT